MLKPSELKDKIIKLYMDDEGLVTIDSCPTPQSTGNGLMHTGLFYTMLNVLNADSYQDHLFFYKTIRELQVKEGVYDRNKGRKDHTAHDDVIGVFSGSVHTGGVFHAEITSHAIRNWGIFNNTGLSDFSTLAKAFLVRHWIFTGLLIGYENRFIAKLMLKFMLKFPAKSYHILLHYMVVETLSKAHPTLSGLRYDILNKMRLVDECERYFGKEHPMVDLARHVEGYSSYAF